jgi:hypothetical protein
LFAAFDGGFMTAETLPLMLLAGLTAASTVDYFFIVMFYQRIVNSKIWPCSPITSVITKMLPWRT